MTTKEYLTKLQATYLMTYTGLEAFHKENNKTAVPFINYYNNVPLDFVITFIIKYLEKRDVNFLEALSVSAIDNVIANHETLRLITVTAVMHRLEKFIDPAEGLPF